MLLLPIGFGAILANIPHSAVIGTAEEPGFLKIMYNVGITTELFPILIFIAIGAMVDFTPVLKNPFMIFFGAAAQMGIFLTILMMFIIIIVLILVYLTVSQVVGFFVDIFKEVIF